MFCGAEELLGCKEKCGLLKICDTDEELRVLNELYIYLDSYVNYFQPVLKLISKTRVGSKVTKKYDRAKTPYRRVLES